MTNENAPEFILAWHKLREIIYAVDDLKYDTYSYLYDGVKGRDDHKKELEAILNETCKIMLHWLINTTEFKACAAMSYYESRIKELKERIEND